MSNVTGYYGAQTSIAYQNKCNNLNSSQPTSVTGMSKYADSEFGFSFWYPSGWKVTKENVPTTGTDREWDVSYLNVGKSITLMVRKPMDDGKFFASAAPFTTFSDTDIRGTSMGSLPIFYRTTPLALGVSWYDAAVQLNQNYEVYVGWDNNGVDPRPVLRTISLTTSSTALTLSAQQIATIQAEAAAFGISVTSTTQTENQYLVANPATGSAPLQVLFQASPIGDGNATMDVGSIDFGDGSASKTFGSMGDISLNSCQSDDFTCSHTYSHTGTYVAHIYSPSGVVMGTATVTVQ